jgi:hypothetical protein
MCIARHKLPAGGKSYMYIYEIQMISSAERVVDVKKHSKNLRACEAGEPLRDRFKT